MTDIIEKMAYQIWNQGSHNVGSWDTMIQERKAVFFSQASAAIVALAAGEEEFNCTMEYIISRTMGSCLDQIDFAKNGIECRPIANQIYAKIQAYLTYQGFK